MKKGNTEARSSRRESSWQMRPLEEVCDVEYGTRVVQKRDGGKGFPVYGGGGATFEMDRFNREDRLVVARFGMSEECTRFVAGKFFLNDSGLTVSPKDGMMVQRYLDYQMLALNDDIYALGKGTAQKNLDVPVFRTLPLYVPDELAEQQRIVGLLDEAFEGLATAKANAEKNLQNARALFESHLQAVFTQRGVGWVEKALGDICVVDWGNTDLTKSSYVDGGKYLAVSAAGCDGRIGHKEHAKHTPVLSAIGAQCGRMFLPEEDFTAIKNTITLTPRVGTCAGKFLYRLLTHVELPKRGAAQPFIAKGDILKFQIVVPEDSEAQLRIVDSLDELEEETQRLARLYERKLAALEELKKSLLHQAFSGDL